MTRTRRPPTQAPSRIPTRIAVAVLVATAAAAWSPHLPAAEPPPDPPAPTEEAPAPAPPGDPPSWERVADGSTGQELRPDSPAAMQEVTVFLRDGQRFSGLLVEQTPDYVILRIEGIQTRFPTSRVDRVRILPPVLERYREMREAIGEDPDQLIKLADWLRAREHLELALEEADRALRLNPESTDARQLRLLIAKQIELRGRSRTRVDEMPGPGPDAPELITSRLQQEFPLLTPEQINLIKVYEVDLKRPPRMVIRRETVRKLLEQYGRHSLIPVQQEAREAIYRKSPREILDLMFRIQARDLYGEVQIIDQPDSMKLFRDHVNRTWLVNSCATNACHGGEAAGRLVLYNRRPNSEQSLYTNFLILERFRFEDGTPLIDYDYPQRSALLHMALPREDSLSRHPLVPQGIAGHDGWKPVFRNTEDRRFKHAVEWIESMYRPRPEHPIEYTPPGASSTVAGPSEGVPR